MAKFTYPATCVYGIMRPCRVQGIRNVSSRGVPGAAQHTTTVRLFHPIAHLHSLARNPPSGGATIALKKIVENDHIMRTPFESHRLVDILLRPHCTVTSYLPQECPTPATSSNHFTSTPTRRTAASLPPNRRSGRSRASVRAVGSVR